MLDLKVLPPATQPPAKTNVEMDKLTELKNVILVEGLEQNPTMETSPTNAERGVYFPNVVTELLTLAKNVMLGPTTELPPVPVINSANGPTVETESSTTPPLTEPRRLVMMETISMEMVVLQFANMNAVTVTRPEAKSAIWELTMPMPLTLVR
jgi:hypothetical protein